MSKSFSSQLLDPDELRSLDPAQWDRLSATALVENPFYSRQYMIAGLNTIDRRAGVHALAVHDVHGQLVGLFPFRRSFPRGMAIGAENLYQFSGIPLVAREGSQAIIDIWLDRMQDGTVPKIWTLPNFDMNSPLSAILEASVQTRGMAFQAIIPYARPHLTSLNGGFAEHSQSVIAKRRLKDIERNIRRLREMGELVFERVTEPMLLRQRLQQFLEMEQAGWKGERGTAFLSVPADAEFARQAFGGSAEAEGLTTIDSLLLDGRPIAISINIASGNTAYTPKCTYDETLRKQGPGLVLEYLVIERFYEANEFIDMDAATTSGGHVVLGLWNGEKQMARAIIGPGDWRTRCIANAWTAFHAKKQQLKALLGR